MSPYPRALGNALQLDQRILYNVADLDSQYDIIEKRRVKEGFPLIQRQPDPRRVQAVIRSILAKYQTAEQVRRKLQDRIKRGVNIPLNLTAKIG